MHLYILYSAAGCGPIGLISAGIAKSMGAVKMYIILLDVNLVKWSYISCLFTVGVVLTQPEDSTFILINSIMYQLSIKMCQCPIAKIALLRFCLHPWFRNNSTACTRDNPFYCISPLSTSLEQAISVNNEPFAILKNFLLLGQTVQKNMTNNKILKNCSFSPYFSELPQILWRKDFKKQSKWVQMY